MFSSLISATHKFSFVINLAMERRISESVGIKSGWFEISFSTFILGQTILCAASANWRSVSLGFPITHFVCACGSCGCLGFFGFLSFSFSFSFSPPVSSGFSSTETTSASRAFFGLFAYATQKLLRYTWNDSFLRHSSYSVHDYRMSNLGPA